MSNLTGMTDLALEKSGVQIEQLIENARHRLEAVHEEQRRRLFLSLETGDWITYDNDRAHRVWKLEDSEVLLRCGLVLAEQQTNPMSRTVTICQKCKSYS